MGSRSGILRSRILRLLMIFLFTATVGMPSAALAERTIGLSTGTIDLALAPGQSADGSLRVLNTGDEPFKALIYTSDVTYDQEGIPVYERPTGETGEYLGSPASWLRIRVPDSTKIVANTPYVEMQPGDEFDADFTMVVPSNATPGDHNAVIFFEMFEFADGDTGAVSRISGRIGARVKLRVVGDIRDQMELTLFSTRLFVLGGRLPYTFQVHNEGNIDKPYDASIQILDPSGEILLESHVDTETAVYAQAVREHNGVLGLEGVGLGRYTVRAVAEYDKEVGSEAGTLEPASVFMDRTVWVVPIWVAVLAILAVGIPMLWLSWRSARRKGRPSRRRSHRRDERSDRRERGAVMGEGLKHEAPSTEIDTEPAEESVRKTDIWVPDEIFRDRDAGPTDT